MFRWIRQDIARNFEPLARDEDAWLKVNDTQVLIQPCPLSLLSTLTTSFNPAPSPPYPLSPLSHQRLLLKVNDQQWFWRYFLKHPKTALLDVEGRIFHTLHGVHADQLTPVDGQPGTVFSNVTR
jgi:hypothetical protein